jgi:hypothetical protein
MLNLTSEKTLSFAPEPDVAFTRNDSLGYAGIVTLSAITLGIARALTPSPSGFGTHQQLGLPPCAFLHWTGYPCPSCGLTTCFAYAAHGQFAAAFIAQPFGLLAFVLTIALIPCALWCIRRRIAWSQVIYARATNLTMRVLLVLYLLSWAYKIFAMRGWR